MKRAIQCILFLAFLCCIFSCKSSPDKAQEEESATSSIVGTQTEALQTIERGRGERRSEYNRNDILYYLDRGMMNHYNGLYNESSEDLAEAERLIEDAFTKSLTQEVATFITNDNARDYSGEDYEDIYINVFNALNHYHLNDIESALVEIRRVNEKLAVLADKYVEAREKALSSAPDIAGADLDIEAVQFSNSALARYLGALFYRANGDDDDARIDLDEIHLAYELSPNVYNNSLPSSIEEERSIPRGMARLNVIGFVGLSPLKLESQIDLPTIFLPPPNDSFLLALPEMVERPSGIESIEVILDTGEKFRLELLEDMSKVAAETFKGKYGLIKTKTFIRAYTKAVAAGATAKGAEMAATRQGGALVGRVTGLVAGFAGRLAADASERADVRISHFFPSCAYVGGINLEPGIYSITVNYYGAGGGLITTEHQDDVVVEENKLNLTQFSYYDPNTPNSPPQGARSGLSSALRSSFRSR